MLQGVLGLLTGWALLTPALLTAYLGLGGGYYPWMAAFLGIAASVPMLAFFTLGGVAVIALSVRGLSHKRD
jgi:hypothetical protein